MRIGRDLSQRLTWWLDQAIPPALRDSKLFAALARRAYRRTSVDIVELKTMAHYMSAAELNRLYATLEPRFDQGDTDLTDGSVAGVVEAIVGTSVLDVACGKGFLARRLTAAGLWVVGCDVAGRPGVMGAVEALPFIDGSFDTVVSTHTLEHVPRPALGLEELRRVARHRVVVVLPRQRPYRPTFNQHLHFFPYDFSVLSLTGTDRPHTLRLAGGDWLYVEG